jgi:thermitase
MHNKTVYGILALLFIVVVSTVFFPSKSGEEESAETKRFGAETNNIQKQNDDDLSKTKLVEIDSIKNGHILVKQLNDSSSITTLHHSEGVQSHYIGNQVTVNFKGHLDEEKIADINQVINGKLVRRLDSVYVFSSEKLNAAELVQYFDDKKNVKYAEPNYIYLQNQQPNDRLYEEYQWNLPLIKTEAGWNISQGNQNIQTAVIDTGVDLDHPDLAGRLTEGYNVLADNNRPEDKNGHGTHVAGIIASKTNNREGIAGITWYSQIMPIKVMGAEGSGTAFDVAKGIRWATDHGADIINMSLGNYQSSKVLREAAKYAFENDVVLIAASGNENTDRRSYPAALPEVLSVAAVNQNAERASFSNFGNYIDVAAPGVQIASTYKNGKYAALSGTSMAAPHVSALAGLIRSLDPNLSNKEVTEMIKETSDDLGQSGIDPYYGTGLINIEKALQTNSQEQQQPFSKFRGWLENLTTESF